MLPTNRKQGYVYLQIYTRPIENIAATTMYRTGMEYRRAGPAADQSAAAAYRPVGSDRRNRAINSGTQSP